MYHLNTEFAKDIVLFEQNGKWFAAALESDEISSYTTLRIYQQFVSQRWMYVGFKILQQSLQGNTFEGIHDFEVNKAVGLSLYTTLKGTFIAIAENRSEDDPMTRILLFPPDMILKEVQMLNVNYVTDVLLWQFIFNISNHFAFFSFNFREQNSEIFLAVAQAIQIRTNETSYDTTTVIYKWLGEHFDIIQELPSYHPQKLAFIQIGNTNFLAIANNRNDRGESNIFSEIFKYDLQTQQFLSHQRIATKSAKDVKFFSFTVENFRETFMIIANYYDEGK